MSWVVMAQIICPLFSYMQKVDFLMTKLILLFQNGFSIIMEIFYDYLLLPKRCIGSISLLDMNLILYAQKGSLFHSKIAFSDILIILTPKRRETSVFNTF